MAGWVPFRPRRPPAASAHLLAISDLHLGHDLKRGQPPLSRDVPAVDAPLASFLDHHRAHRRNGLPWRLVIVGDMIDFIAITLTPGRDESVPFQVSPDERLYGLNPEPGKTAWKLQQVLARHRTFFTALASFVEDGNELVVVCGNHDPEWAWAEIQEAFRTGLTGLGPGQLVEPAGRRADRRRAFEERIRFYEWFYLEPGRFYAEHGHYYDEYSISGDLLPGATRADGAPAEQAIREPVSTLAMRYFANKHSALDMNAIELWSFMDFVRWGFDGGRFFRKLADYFIMCGRVLSFSARASARTWLRSVKTLGRAVVQREERLAHVRRAVRAVRADQEELTRGLLALLRPPAEQSVVATARMLYFDRILLGAGVVFCAAACALIPGPASTRGGILLGALLGGTLANGWLARARLIDAHPKQIAAAHRVAVLFKVPLVVMGHTHRAIMQTVGEGARYFNLGTWVGPIREAAQHPGFPYLVLDGAGPALLRWSILHASREVA